MKLIAMFAMAMCLAFVGCSESASGPDDGILAADNKVEAKIDGMTCSGCSSEVVSAVKEIDGVDKCHADAKTGQVVVALDDDADAGAKMLEVEKVIAGLSDGKYTVSTITVSPNEAAETSCPAGCEKACCTGDTTAKACPVGCDKPCCAAEGEAKVCPAGCEKECCKKPAESDTPAKDADEDRAV